jgi:hypothetical protein
VGDGEDGCLPVDVTHVFELNERMVLSFLLLLLRPKLLISGHLPDFYGALFSQRSAREIYTRCGIR